MKNSLALVVGICVLTFSCHQSVQPDLSTKVTAGATIEAIDVRGFIRVSNETIRHNLHSRVGERVSLPAVKSDIQFLYTLGFEKVLVDEEPGRIGKIIVFQVKEKAPPQTLAP
jgi:outer membrane protein assembly factor BamA